jgi:hypothetical protein
VIQSTLWAYEALRGKLWDHGFVDYRNVAPPGRKEIDDALQEQQVGLSNFISSHLLMFYYEVKQLLPVLFPYILHILLDLPDEDVYPVRQPRLADLLASIDAQVAGQALGCTEQEIEALEARFSLRLPSAYREYLQWIGREAGAFMRGMPCFYPEILEAQEKAKELLQRDHAPLPLPEDALVTAFFPDQSFTFIRCSEGENPPLYYHRREWRADPFRQIYRHFSDMLLIQLTLYDVARNNTLYPVKKSCNYEIARSLGKEIQEELLTYYSKHPLEEKQ